MNLKDKLLKLYSALPSHNKWIFWILISLLIKSGFFLYKVSYENASENNHFYKETFAMEGGDTYSYFEPIENYLNTGVYFGKFYEDYRMPGYGFIYYSLKLLLPVSYTLNTIVILQLILSAISVYVLSKITLVLFGHQIYFYITFFLYALSTYVSLFDHVLLTESFSTSFLIFALYFLLKSDKNPTSLLYSGLFLTWCVFMKPVMAILLIIFLAYIIIKFKESLNFLKLSKNILIFFIPFILADSLWISRNYSLYGKIIPLTKTKYYPGTSGSYLGGLFDFMKSFGGSIVYWKPGAEISYFIPTPKHVKKKKPVTFPDYIFTNEFNRDSLSIVRDMVLQIRQGSNSRNVRDSLNNVVIEKLVRYTNSIKEEKPILFYIMSRIKLFKSYFVHSGTYNLFNKSSFELNLHEYMIKIIYSLYYLGIVFLGLTGSLIAVFSKSDLNIKLVIVTGLCVSLVYPLVFKLDEFRYLVSGYPLLLVASVFILFYINNRYFKHSLKHGND